MITHAWKSDRCQIATSKFRDQLHLHLGRLTLSANYPDFMWATGSKQYYISFKTIFVVHGKSWVSDWSVALVIFGFGPGCAWNWTENPFCEQSAALEQQHKGENDVR